MNTDNASLYVKWLKQEVAPALGCTEPVAISFTAAYAAQYLDQPCTKISGFISANLYKNAMGVTIPGTTVCGVALAAAIGAFGGNPQKGLKTLEDITPLHVEMAQKLIANNAVDIAVEETPDFIHLDLTLSAGENNCRVVVKGTHTNVVELYINGQPQPLSAKQNASARHETLPTFSLQQAYEFINNADFNDIRFILEAARLNSVLAAEGKTKKYGLNINGTFADAVKNGLMSNDLLSKVIINTVAASDARMGGAPVVAMSNFGSGNQGITATMPVVVVAEHLGADEETLARALSLSHLTAISIHSRYTRLSALCAASTAAMGAAAGMAWLFTRDINTINTAIINMVSDITGMICDGASNSCAMKVSSVVSSAFKAVLMAMKNSCAGANDGIVCADVEQTINNLCRLVIKPMALTDKEIISIMVAK
ncbi:L-serine ammonia-lyase, iron-sulfur-dependent, subunit alpha [Klebsiella aerogenes]|uniref:L-cysteine desulfidase family protein n=1 Tax=Klebsiella aerogenes TaxID=548 RepID=UPI0021A32E56|nr:L-serine ammonia-lyase, iron-sulfur-dependent, subunit alpha [Klebsiella aerogenes]MCT1424287.1 L-serine ammonia-lyase, iron-sulfur-dependent, subunit alpha [Klebsiella aerogenes]MCT1504433.1 L-serine ammonia-lyase, iron-sulfur-dependent, subunit alpha [Klebsiella aerogenes]MCT1794766.1 L-serine ammonia-lyase, iron-sulfur-dependent, subunit alpha [Klebsiella aerogenes]MCT2312042.1 L-serine ammonia-lyase, iron-sulfur-dependent, subunit alpha [Klebsiella aerogenes]MCT2321635.1 L-serine ammoni